MTAEKQRIINNLSDSRWRLSNLYAIIDKHGKKVPFVLNDAQEELLKNMHTNNIVLKARQLGMTTFIQIYMLDKCLFRSNLRCGVIAHNRNDAQVFFRDKIKFAYDSLPEWLKAERECYNDSATELRLSNNSSIRVGTSLRSGTNQLLHISEFGKICAQYPLKAKEIMTGALNTVQSGQQIFIESTAEGNSGYFYDMCQEAMAKQRKGTKLGISDFRFHFFPWHRDDSYRLQDNIAISAENSSYFKDLLESHNIDLTKEQQAWYQSKSLLLHDEMKREYPSTADESFYESVEGSYYIKQLNESEKDGRVCSVPVDRNYPVNTYWDLGVGDDNAIWFIQHLNGGRHHAVDYFEASGEGLDYYIELLKDKKYQYGKHYVPHDAKQREWTNGLGRIETARQKGIDLTLCPKTSVADGINAVRSILNRCWFDEKACEVGLRALRNYRKLWDPARGVFRPEPYHDWASHGSDAFRLFAMNTGRNQDQQSKPKQRATSYSSSNISTGAAWI